MQDLPTLDELFLATEKLALGTGDLGDISMSVHNAVDPENPPTISLEQAGALFLYATDCESQAKDISENAARLLSDIQAFYYGQATEEQMTGSQSRDLVAAWHRESVES